MERVSNGINIELLRSKWDNKCVHLGGAIYFPDKNPNKSLLKGLLVSDYIAATATIAS